MVQLAKVSLQLLDQDFRFPFSLDLLITFGIFVSEKKKIPKVIRRSSEKGKRKFWSSNLRDTLAEITLL